MDRDERRKEREELLLEKPDPHSWLPLESKSRDVRVRFFVFKLIYIFVYLLVPNGSLDKATAKITHFTTSHPLLRM